MKPEHTPGPWKAMAHGETISINALGRQTYIGVAHVNSKGNFGAGIPSKLDRANARLLAAAPELLAACKAALEALRNVPCVGDLYDQQHSDTQLAADKLLVSVIAKTMTPKTPCAA